MPHEHKPLVEPADDGRARRFIERCRAVDNNGDRHRTTPREGLALHAGHALHQYKPGPAARPPRSPGRRRQRPAVSPLHHPRCTTFENSRWITGARGRWAADGSHWQGDGCFAYWTRVDGARTGCCAVCQRRADQQPDGQEVGDCRVDGCQSREGNHAEAGMPIAGSRRAMGLGEPLVGGYDRTRIMRTQ